MGGRRGLGPHWLRACILAFAFALGQPTTAQDVSATLLTLDQDRLFLESDFGKAVIEKDRAATAELEQENRLIEAGLVAEEQALTEARATLSAEEFTAKAEAFDAKVEQIRSEQDGKARKLTEGRDKDRQAFLQLAAPVLGELLRDKQAAVVLDKKLVILSLSSVDITDEAIARVNAALAEQSAPKP
jgi:Skp family chaperone for outer membrane proteins